MGSKKQPSAGKKAAETADSSQDSQEIAAIAAMRTNCVLERNLKTCDDAHRLLEQSIIDIADDNDALRSQSTLDGIRRQQTARKSTLSFADRRVGMRFGVADVTAGPSGHRSWRSRSSSTRRSSARYRRRFANTPQCTSPDTSDSDDSRESSPTTTTEHLLQRHLERLDAVHEGVDRLTRQYQLRIALLEGELLDDQQAEASAAEMHAPQLPVPPEIVIESSSDEDSPLKMEVDEESSDSDSAPIFLL